MLLIDWELAGRGAAAFDVGTVLAEYLCAWVGSIPIVEPERSRAACIPAQGIRSSRMQPAIHAFWSAYRRREPAPASRATGGRVRGGPLGCMTAIERAAGLAAANAHVVTLVQLADEHAGTPEEAALRLLGLRRVSHYRDQVAAALRAVTHPRRDALCVARPCEPALPASLGDELDTFERRSHLVAGLREELYRSFYCHGQPVPARWGEPGPVGGRSAADTGACPTPTAGSGAGIPDGRSNGSTGTRR